MRTFLRAVFALAILILSCSTAPLRADEPLFGFIYATDTLPKGQKEIEQWVTLRDGRSQGTFHLWQTRTEFSYGLTDKLQLSGYLNLAQADVDANTPSGETVPPEVFADYASDPDGPFKRSRFESASVEALYRFSSPYTSRLGAAVYVEPSIGPRTQELEVRLILQKDFLDDRLVFAFNSTLGYELRKLPADPGAEPGSEELHTHWDKETDVNFGLAGSYRFSPNLSLGAELQNEHEWAGLNPLKRDQKVNQATYFGPTLHFGGRHFFATATVLKQLPWARDYANPAGESVVVHGITNADDFENYRFRLKVGYYF